MATIDSKAIVDNIIENGGFYEGDRSEPRAIKVVEYTNAWGKTTYGVVFENEAAPDRYEQPTEFVRRPVVIWEASEKGSSSPIA